MTTRLNDSNSSLKAHAMQTDRTGGIGRLLRVAPRFPAKACGTARPATKVDSAGTAVPALLRLADAELPVRVHCKSLQTCQIA
jgi:hypothetical protein